MISLGWFQYTRLFSGKENELWNAESSTSHWLRGERYQHFGARYYDPVACAWTGEDPLAEKYYGITPYAYCAGDPVNKIDLNGRDTVLVIDASNRPRDNGIKGTSYTAEIYFIKNGIISQKFRGSSYPNSVSNSNNMPAANTVKEGEYLYNNKYGHKGGTEKGLNIHPQFWPFLWATGDLGTGDQAAGAPEVLSCTLEGKGSARTGPLGRG